jgi:hypothetical protein
MCDKHSHNSVPNPSADENTTRNSVPWNQNRSKFSEFRSEPFRGRETNSDQNAAAEYLKIVSERTTFDVQTNHFVKLFCCCFVKLIFSAEFHSVPSFGIGSSEELGMPRNECFLPRNNGNHSESIPWNFFGTKFRSQPYPLFPTEVDVQRDQEEFKKRVKDNPFLYFSFKGIVSRDGYFMKV